jgi:hypothetical protein
MVNRCLHVWSIFSYVMSCFGYWLSSSVLVSFQSTSAFFTCGFLTYFLVSFVPFFSMPERIGLCKMFAKVELLHDTVLFP